MKRWLVRGAVGLGVAMVALAALAITATVGWRALILGPRARPLTERRFEPTPARLERGRYLVESVCVCLGCHSPRDWSRPGGPPVPGREGAGLVWSEEGMPWLTAPNLTPDPETGLGEVGDDAVARAIREGIGHDGRALFPLMPYGAYRKLSDEDVAAIIVYLRTLAPVRNPLPRTDVPFPLGVLIRAVPEPVTAPVAEPHFATPVERGAWLADVASCRECHTPRRRGDPIPGLDMAGGFVLDSSAGAVASVNLTPSPSGIPYYDEALFLEVMRTGQVHARKLHPMMPWAYYRGMTERDLRDLFAWLRSLPPVAHRVSNVDPPTACRLCDNSHGLGAGN